MDRSQILQKGFPAMSQEAEISVCIFSAFDTGIVIDTASLNLEQYRDYANKTMLYLQESYPKAKWTQEDAFALHGSDDAIDFFPTLNLSFVKAICPLLLAERVLNLSLPNGTRCTAHFSESVVYFHTFSAGTVSLEAVLNWDKPYTSEDLHQINRYLLMRLAPLVEPQLPSIIQAFVKGVHHSKCPLYIPPFAELVPATTTRNFLYWSHFVYVARADEVKSLNASINCLKPLMMPINDKKVENMALRSDRYIYFGWGRSMIGCLRSLPHQSISSYVHALETRNYLWKTLYDLDRGLRNAVVEVRKIRSEEEASKLSENLRALDFRIKEILEGFDSFKLTFDHEKIWLMKQLDENWLTRELVNSLQTRLQSFQDFYDFSEETTRRLEEKRLQNILNVIAVFSTAGAITSIINFFDTKNQLSIFSRGILLGLFLLLVICVYLIAVRVSRARRQATFLDKGDAKRKDIHSESAEEKAD